MKGKFFVKQGFSGQAWHKTESGDVPDTGSQIRFSFENRKRSRWCLSHDFGTLNEEITLTKRKGDLRL